MGHSVLVKIGEATPFAPQTRVMITATKLKGTLLKQCRCTSTSLHYEVLIDGSKNVSSLNHADITQISE